MRPDNGLHVNVKVLVPITGPSATPLDTYLRTYLVLKTQKKKKIQTSIKFCSYSYPSPQSESGTKIHGSVSVRKHIDS